MKRTIKKVAILGSGVMGSRIACHFANIGCKVYLLDIVPQSLKENEAAKGLTLESPQVRNRIVTENLNNVLKAKPAPLYHNTFASRILTGNFDDNLDLIKECDWIIEAVVENLDIKKGVFEKVERNWGTKTEENSKGYFG